MNDDDLRDCFAMFALAGALMASKSRTAEEIWQIADEMMEERKSKGKDNQENTGIATVAPKRPRKR